jgi:prolyl-tRNA synthetase
LGEDVVVHCKSCGYTANEEVAETSSTLPANALEGSASIEVWRGISKDRRTLVNAWYPSNNETPAAINIHAVKNLVPDLDTSVENAVPFWAEAVREQLKAADSQKLQLINLVDSKLSKVGLVETDVASSLVVPLRGDHAGIMQQTTITTAAEGETLNLVRIRDGDPCTRCGTGTLEVQKTLELGHTFHLGTRYSDPLGATVSIPCEPPNERTTRTFPLEMGCFGIGISRLMGAIANRFADSAGLRWPVNIAPYEVAIVCETSLLGEAEGVYDLVAAMAQGGRPSSSGPVDVILDDRKESIAWKLKDADLTGYPVVIVLGRAWREGRGCEVQCRWLGEKEIVKVEDLASHLASLYDKL